MDALLIGSRIEEEEARAASLVQHPSVVAVLDVFELDGGVPVMVMDLLVGETLGAKLARDKVLPEGEVAALLLPVVEAVEAAHAMGIIHRDLKPDNIFLKSAEGGKVEVKVLDFGIAKLTAKEGDAAETGSITGTGSVVGTPWYMAPEQICGEKDVDRRADVWAVGVILYECLAGQRPVEGSNVGQLVKKMLHDDIVPIEARVPSLTPELARLVRRLLSRERGDRPESLAPVREVLAAMTGGSPRLAARGAPERAETRDDAGGTPPRWDTGGPHAVPGPSVSRTFGPRRMSAAVMIAAAAAAIGWGVVHSVSRSASDPPRASTAGAPPRELAAVGLMQRPSAAAGLRANAGDAAEELVSPPVTLAPGPSANLAPIASAPRPTPVDTSRSGERPGPGRLRSAADAGAVTARGEASAAPANQPPAAPSRGSSDGGLFQEVPF